MATGTDCGVCAPRAFVLPYGNQNKCSGSLFVSGADLVRVVNSAGAVKVL